MIAIEGVQRAHHARHHHLRRHPRFVHDEGFVQTADGGQVAVGQGAGQGLLVGEELVQRTNTGARFHGDEIGGGGVVANLGEHLLGGVEDSLDALLRTGLTRLAAQHSGRRRGGCWFGASGYHRHSVADP